MKSRLWLNLALLALVGVLVLLVIYEPGSDKPPAPSPLTTIKSEAITRILIRRENPGKPAEEIRLEKTGNRWFMRQPYAMPADDFRVRSLLRLAETASLGRHDLGGLTLATYGLDAPRATVTFNDDTVIRFGKTEPLSHRRYVQLGDQLNLIEDLYYYQAAGNLSLYLSHALLPPDSKITRLQLPELRLELKDGTWQRTPPHEAISADASAELITAWQHAQAVEVRTGQAVPENRHLPVIRVQLQDQDAPIEFFLDSQGEKKDSETLLIRRDNGLQYVINPDLARQLLGLAASEEEETATGEPASPAD